MALDTLSLSLASIGLLVFAVWWFRRRNDELPLAIAGFNFLFIRRLWIIEDGLTDWAQFDYGLGFSFSAYSHEAATYMLMGAAILIAAYCITLKRRVAVNSDSEESLRAYLVRQRPKIIAGFVVFATANAIIRLWFDDSEDLLYSSSYIWQLSLANSGFIIMFAVLVVYAERGTLAQKAALLGLVALTGVLTINPTLRFAMLGWAVALAFVFTSEVRPTAKLAGFAVIGAFVALVFSTAGAMRNPDLKSMSGSDIFQEGGYALLVGRDINMLDGFTMVMQVYPEALDYGLGREHLEVFTRPIPRAIWADKPVGGWNQKIALQRGMDLYGTGISPSIYGSFYGEGGVIGVVVLSALYGFLFARYVNWANRHRSIVRWVLRGVLIASLFALIRGGDIPGIAAFIGMSYWPIALFILGYRRALRRQPGPFRRPRDSQSPRPLRLQRGS
jgi:hypothetical protein